MSRQRVLGAAVVWLAVVATVSALVWVVISHAGDGLVASDQPFVTTRSERGTAAPRTPSSRTSPTPTKAPTRTPSRTPSASPSPVPSATASPSTGAPTDSPSTPTTPSTSPSTSPTEQPSTPATEERRTWQGPPGSVVVSCGATGIRSVFAQPVDGFRAEVHREDDLVDVEFEGQEDESGLHVSVTARCVGGVPTFSAQSEQED